MELFSALKHARKKFSFHYQIVKRLLRSRLLCKYHMKSHLPECRNRIQLECMHLKMRLGLAFHQKCQLVPQSQYTLQIQYRLSIESNTSSQRLAKWLDSRWLRQNKEWTIRFHRHSRAKQKYVL